MAQPDAVTPSSTSATSKAEMKTKLTIRTSELQDTTDVTRQEADRRVPEDRGRRHGDEGLEDSEDAQLEVLSQASSSSGCRSDATCLTEPEVSSEKNKSARPGTADETVEVELSLGPEWWHKSPPHKIMSQMQLTFFQHHQKTMMAMAQTMGLVVDDLDLDDQGKLALKESAFASDRSSRRSDPEKEITVQDLFVDEHGLVRVNDSACVRLGLPLYRYPWEPDESVAEVEGAGASPPACS